MFHSLGTAPHVSCAEARSATTPHLNGVHGIAVQVGGLLGLAALSVTVEAYLPDLRLLRHAQAKQD